MPAADHNTATIAVIEGDDASPEVVRPTVQLLTDMQLGINWVYPLVGELAEREHGSPFPDSSREMIDAADTTLFGSTSGKSTAALFHLRWGKQTYANVRPCVYLPGCASPLAHPEGINFAIVRENLEDLYVRCEGDLAALSPLNLRSGTGGQLLHNMAPGRFAIKAITEAGSERVIRFAFELARKRDVKKRVTVTQKHNMLATTDGLFKQVAERVALDYPDIEFETFIVDDFACRLLTEPQRLDVVVMPNLYGDILSDAAAGLVGSLGMAASGCYGEDYAYFESAHGTAPDLAGCGVINPTATLLTASMMLRELNRNDPADAIEQAVREIYAEGKSLTPDQGGNKGTADFIANMRARVL